MIFILHHGPSNLTEKVPVIGVYGMVSRAWPRHTRDCLTPGKLNKPTVMEHVVPFPAKIQIIVL